MSDWIVFDELSVSALLVAGVAFCLHWLWGNSWSDQGAVIGRCGAVLLAATAMHPLLQSLGLIASWDWASWRSAEESTASGQRSWLAKLDHAGPPLLVLLGVAPRIWPAPADSALWPIGAILWLTGAGLGGGWFPFPLARADDQRQLSRVAALVILPALATAIAWRRWSIDAAAPVSVFAFGAVCGAWVSAACAVRLLRETVLTSRLRWSVGLSLGSWLMLAALTGAIDSHVHPFPAGVFPSATSLFSIALTAESLALWACVSGALAVHPEVERDGRLDSLAGAARSHPWATGLLLLAIGSLAALPPTSGFWWRQQTLQLMSWIGQKQGSQSLFEAHSGFRLLAVVFVLTTLAGLFAHMAAVAQILFSPDFRLPLGAARRRRQLAAVALAGCWLAVSWSQTRVSTSPADAAERAAPPSSLTPASRSQ